MALKEVFKWQNGRFQLFDTALGTGTMTCLFDSHYSPTRVHTTGYKLIAFKHINWEWHQASHVEVPYVPIFAKPPLFIAMEKVGSIYWNLHTTFDAAQKFSEGIYCESARDKLNIYNYNRSATPATDISTIRYCIFKNTVAH
jgi:hypothetical protein